MKKLLRIFSQIGPLQLVIAPFIFSLIFLSISRGILSVIYWERIVNTPDFYWLFIIGLRMDVIFFCYAMSVPLSLVLLFSKNFLSKYLRTFLLGWILVVVFLAFFMEMATYQFIEEYDLRPDRKFFEYLSHPSEVFGTLWKSYFWQVISTIFIVISCGWMILKIEIKIFNSYADWSYIKRLIILPFMVLLFVLGGRSTLEHKPANVSTAYFSNNHFVNELALNSSYTLFYAIYRSACNEKNPATLYGAVPIDKAVNYMGKLVQQAGNKYLKSDIPFLHQQISPYHYDKPVNIVLILMESIGASDTGCLTGPDITPNICRLKNEGIWFSNLYATGTRTARGIEAVFTGFLPSASSSVIKSEKAKSDFFTMASLLKGYGYESSFIYGGMSNFDEMRSFFLGNGGDKIYDEPTFKNPIFTTTWGVSDEDLFKKANEVFKKSSKPFFSFILTTSNHVPYEFPDGRIKYYERPKNTHLNAVKYSDYAIGKFFDDAKKEEYFKNTLFVIVSDHNSQVRGNELVPIDKYHIPALILGPNVPKMTISKVCSQIDLMPTLLHFSGLTTVHPMIGRNMMLLPENEAGRAIMQYSDHVAYRKGDQVLVLRPMVMPIQFDIKDSSLVETALSKELTREALSYAYLPWYLYDNKLYRNR